MPNRDYAKRPVGMGPLRMGILVTSLTLLVAASFTGGFFLGRDYGHQEMARKEREQLMAALQAQPRPTPPGQDAREEAGDDRFGELTFYTELPSQSVTPAPLTAPPPKAEETPSPARRAAPAKAKRSVPRRASPPPNKEARTSAPAPQAGRSAPPRPAAPAPAGYRIQVASFQSAAEARNLRKRLAKIGVPAWSETIELAGRGRWHRVYAGPFPTRDQAEKVRQRIERKLHLRGLIRKD